jgi:hypothetical protein
LAAFAAIVFVLDPIGHPDANPAAEHQTLPGNAVC